MPRYIRAKATKTAISSRDLPTAIRAFAAREARGEEQRDPAVDGDRRGRVPRRIAGVHGKLLEPVHGRPMRGGPRASSPGTSPDSTASAKSRKPARRHCLSAAATTRATPATIGRTTPPAMIEPTSDASVSPPER